MLVIEVPIKEGLDLAAVEKAMLEECNNVNNMDDVGTIIDFYYGVRAEEEYYNHKDFTKEELDKVKADFKNVVGDFFKCLNYRDVTYFTHKGDTIYITGGMSWGDNPTESYSVFDEFVNLPSKILKHLKSEVE